MTFHDGLAGEYGMPRYSAQEGMFGSQLTTRFGLVRGKRWFRRQTQVELETSMVISITHALSIAHYQRSAGPEPPTQP